MKGMSAQVKGLKQSLFARCRRNCLSALGRHRLRRTALYLPLAVGCLALLIAVSVLPGSPRADGGVAPEGALRLQTEGRAVLHAAGSPTVVRDAQHVARLRDLQREARSVAEQARRRGQREPEGRALQLVAGTHELLGEQPNVRVGVAMITSAPEALTLHEQTAEDLWRRALKGREAAAFARAAVRRQAKSATRLRPRVV